MSGLSTNFNIAPYYDDFDPTKNYGRVLFKPSVPVQTRELTQLQTILQDQISKFGDNILKQGTIIDGCELSLHTMFPYVKIKDTETSGKTVNVLQFENLVVENTNGLKALVIKSVQGFESRNPDLNTMYVRYLNSGDDSNTYQFSAGEVLTVYDQQQRIFSVSINNGSSGFSNTDVLTFVPAIFVKNTSGGSTFANGFYVGDGLSDGANVNYVVTGVSANNDGTILSVRPTYSNIVGGDSSQWMVISNTSLINANTGETAVVSEVLGSKAAGLVTTDSVGRVVDVSISTTGSGYDVAPYTTLVSQTATLAQVQALQLTARNYVAQVTVSNNITIPVGYGYAVTIDQGIIYQKGFFSHVDNQLVIVDKYSNTPSDMCVGFDTEEKVITSNIDSSLLDPASGRSENAPGADRLQLVPTGIAITKTEAEANSNFLSLVEFSEGEAYKLDPVTQYNIIGQTMAKRMNDSDGNFVIDRFQLATKSGNMVNEDATFKYVIDPGVAYINGNRVETVRNYVGSLNKGTDIVTIADAAISVDYGNYIIVENAYGNIFNLLGKTIDLSSATPATPATGAAPADPGSHIGQARVRAVTLHSAGQARKYRIYLFDISMNSGKNFANIKSIYNASSTAVASTVLTNGQTVLQDPGKSAALFSSGQIAVKAVSNVTYTTSDTSSHAVDVSGTITKTLTGSKKFLYTGSISTSALLDIGLVFEANTQSSANLSGSAVLTSGSNTVTGTSTAFNTQLTAGNYVKIANTTANVVVQVASIINATSMTLVSNAPSSITGNAIAFYPANVPVPVANASIDSGKTIMTITLPYAVTAGANASVTSIVNDTNTSIAGKTVNRSAAVRIDTSNNAVGTTGPWPLGVPDAIRLRGVYIGANNTFAPGDAGVSDVTASFYVDHNQTPDFLNTSYLYKKPRGVATVSAGDKMLVVFDVLTTSSNNLRTVSSYPLNDTANLASLTTQMNTLEIPEVFDGAAYYDLRDQFDFRPISANTVAITSNTAAAPINPTEPSYANRFASTFVCPFPKTSITGTIQYYQGRSDRIVITDKNKFTVVKGVPGKYSPPNEPDNVITINNLLIPPYPSLPQAMSSELAQIADTNIANETYTTRRLDTYKIRTTLSDRDIAEGQPRGYKMVDIGKLDSRLTNVENFLAFTAAEAATKNRTLPSSIDGADRFKFGFVVDGFGDADLADVDNPDYHATIRDGWLLPKSDELTIELSPEPGVVPSVPYVEVPGAEQGGATEDDDDCDIIGEDSVQAIVKYIGRHRNRLWDSTGGTTEALTFTMSEQQGPVELYFAFNHAKNSINIYQSKTPSFTDAILIKTASSATSTTNSGNDAAKAPTDLPWSSLVKYGTLGSGTLAAYVASGSGKISWTHNPDNGRYYKVVVGKFGSTGDADANLYIGKWAFALFFPTDADGQDDCEPTRTEHVNYNGQFVLIDPNSFRPSAVDKMLVAKVGGEYYFESQKFKLKATGLKPLTTHSFILENKDLTSKCRPLGGNLGDPLVTDRQGTITFEFFFDADLNIPTSTFALINKMAGSVAGPKTIHLVSGDGSSGAEGTIGVKPYVKAPAPVPSPNTTPTPTTPKPTTMGVTVAAARGFLFDHINVASR
jgi:hypothetical protein